MPRERDVLFPRRNGPDGPRLAGVSRRLPIRWKLAIVFLFVALTPLGALTAWNTARARRETVAVTERFLLLHVQNTVEAIEAHLRERVLDAQRLAAGPLPVRSVAEGVRLTDAERNVMRARFESDRRASGPLRVALLRADGETVLTVGEPIPTQGPASQEAVRAALAGAGVVSDPFFAGPDGPYVVEVAAPVRDAAGAARGVVLSAMPFEQVAAIVRKDNARAGRDSVGLLVDGQMIRIAHGSDPALVGRPLVPVPPPLLDAQVRTLRFGRRTPENLGAPTGHHVFAERLAALRRDPQSSPFFDAAVLVTGKAGRWAAAPLQTKPWAYAITVPYDAFLAPAAAQLRRALAAMAVAAVGTALLAWGLGGIMARRLAYLADATERLAAGDFAARAQAGPADEVGRVAQSFNTMAEALQAHEMTSRDRVARLEALIEVGHAVTATLDLDEVLSLVVEKSVRAIGVYAAAIYALDTATGTLHTIKAQGLSEEYVSSYSLKPGEGLSGVALRDGRAAWTEDIQNDARFLLPEAPRARVAAEGIRAALCVPISTPSGPYGVLALYQRDTQPFNPDQIRFTTVLAAQAGIAIENARLHEERFAQMVALSESLRRLDITQPMEAFFGDMAGIVRQAVGARYAALGILGPEGQMTRFVPVGLTAEEAAGIGPPPKCVGLLGHMLRTPHPVRADDLTRHPESVGFPPHHPPMRSFLGARIVYRDRVIGALYLTEKEGGLPFAPDDERLVEAFAANAAVAIVSAQSYQEITEARRELEAKTHELEAFTYTVSHDLKAPLRGIDGFSRALEEDYADRLDAEGRRYLEMVRASARRMNDLIDDLLKYSRLERRAVRRTRVDLTALAADLLEDRQTQLGAKRLRVEQRLEVPHVEAEPEGLREALANLLDNAIKFSRPGGRITLSSQVRHAPGGGGPDGSGPPAGGAHAVMAVQDEGVGFDPKYHDRLFEIFQRLHRAEEYEGTGVGLAIVKRVAERHGGRAWAVSELGKGSTFYLALPHREGPGT